jgi:hypothetical protein
MPQIQAPSARPRLVETPKCIDDYINKKEQQKSLILETNDRSENLQPKKKRKK